MRHRFSLLIDLSLALALLASCASRYTTATLNDVETYIQARPDSALATIRTIDTTTLTTRKLRAHYALLHAMALDKNWIDTTDVNVVMPAVTYYDKHTPYFYRAKPYYYLGRIQYNGGNYADAIISFMRAEEYSAKLDDPRFKSLIFQAMGDTYGATYLFEEALSFSEESYLLCQQISDTLLASSSLYRIAQNYNNLKQFSKADSLYSSIIRDRAVAPQLYPRVLADEALLCVSEWADYEKAVSLYQAALKHEKGLNSISHWGAYAFALARIGEYDQSDIIFNALEQSGYGKEYAFLVWKSRRERLFGNASVAYDLLETSIAVQDDGVRSVLRQSTLKAQRDFFKIQHLYEQEHHNRKRQILLFVILLLAAMLIIAYLLVKNLKHGLLQKNQELMETVQDMLNERRIKDSLSEKLKMVSDENTFLEGRLSSIKHEYYSANQDTFKELGSLLSVYIKTEGNKSQAESVCGEVRGFIKKLGIDEDKYADLEKRVNNYFDNVMDHLRQELPNHKETFYRTACYLFAGFPIRMIELVLKRDKWDIYKVRSRIKAEAASLNASHQDDFLLLLGGVARL
ncbi:MAG: hypothetical protein IKQ01_01540 [Bacteroidales bacterium]|nr:hypothetical protein [Bacteroidales bacterium]